jgi:hypothetical protein
VSSGDPEQDGGPDAEHPSTPPEPDPLDVDSAFAAIIAGWADAPSSGSWPAEEDLTVGRHRRVDDPNDEGSDGDHAEGGRGRDDRPEISRGPVGGPLIPSLEPPGAGADPPEDDSGGFVPPDPPPIPRGDVVSRLAWAGLIIGPAFLLTSAFVWRGAPQYLVLAAIGGFVGGFVTLVSRMPKHREDDGDDGAVV